MNTTFIGEFVFMQEVKAMGEVWVARGPHNNIYAVEIERGYSLPIWSLRERVVEFLKNALLVGPKYEPSAIPLQTFTDSWLSDKAKGIVELQINPDGKTSKVLVVTVEEFRAAQATE